MLLPCNARERHGQVSAGLTLEPQPFPLRSVYDRFRHVMHEGDVDKRVQYTIEALFLVRKTGFETAGFPAVPPELDLVEPEDQITHEVGARVENSGFKELSPCMFAHLRLRWCCL